MAVVDDPAVPLTSVPLTSVPLTSVPLTSVPHPAAGGLDPLPAPVAGTSPGELATERLEAELISCAAMENACKARFLALLAEFVDRAAWEAWGCVSAVQWLSWQCGLGRVAASEHIRVARALALLPAMAAAFASGALSWSKVRAVTRVAEPDTDEVWAEWARLATAAQLEAIVSVARRISPDDVERQHATEQLIRRCDDDGSVVFTWRVPAEVGAAMVAAVDAELEPERGVPIARSRSRALTRLVLGRSPVTPEVIVHVDAATGSAVTEQGVVVPVEVAGVGICDGAHAVVAHLPDGTVAVSDRRRNPTERVRRALRARDLHCRMPGCHLDGNLDVHHIEHYHHGGSRRMHNLVRLCPGHHRLIHRHQLRLAWSPDGSLTVHRPDGSPLDRSSDVDQGAFRTPEPSDVPVAPHDGEPLDRASVAAALHSLHNLRVPPVRPAVFPAGNTTGDTTGDTIKGPPVASARV